jgi:hypothetical protein
MFATTTTFHIYASASNGQSKQQNITLNLQQCVKCLPSVYPRVTPAAANFACCFDILCGDDCCVLFLLRVVALLKHKPEAAHHASRITHHASRITHHASRMHPLSLTLGCHHNQISAHTVGCGFAGHHRVWLSAAAEQQQRALRASCQRQAATVVRQSAPKQMQRSCKKLRGVRAAAASAATTCIIRQAVIQEKLQQAARVR